MSLPAFGVKVDGIELGKLKAYGLYIVAFVLAIFANMQALSYSNVETVIVFRACSPILVSVIDYLFMGRQWPNVRSSASLLCVFLGAVVYCLSDSQFIMVLILYTYIISRFKNLFWYLERLEFLFMGHVIFISYNI